jgi:hypothetical protein
VAVAVAVAEWQSGSGSVAVAKWQWQGWQWQGWHWQGWQWQGWQVAWVRLGLLKVSSRGLFVCLFCETENSGNVLLSTATPSHSHSATQPLPPSHCHTHISANNTPNHTIRGSRDSHCQSATPISQPITLQITPFQALETANHPQPHLVSTATLPGVSCHSHSHCT